MNGRVYDPLIGRFLSGDPLIDDPMNGQNYNRYSYVLNNPTNLTDPTGFSCLDSGATTAAGGSCPGHGMTTREHVKCYGECGGGGSDGEGGKGGVGGAAAGRKTSENGNQKSDAKNKDSNVSPSASANKGTANQTYGRDMTPEDWKRGVMSDPTVHALTTVFVTAKNLFSDGDAIMTGDATAGAAAKEDLQKNWVKHGASLIVGNPRRGGNPFAKPGYFHRPHLVAKRRGK